MPAIMKNQGQNQARQTSYSPPPSSSTQIPSNNSNQANIPPKVSNNVYNQQNRSQNVQSAPK